MWVVVVVSVLPVGGHAPDFVQAGEDVAVAHLGSQRAIEAFDIGVLGGLAWLDVDQLDALLFRPLLRRQLPLHQPWGGESTAARDKDGGRVVGGAAMT